MPRAKDTKDTKNTKDAQDKNLPEKEWEAARKVISDFDERRHDLRKYGISFVAGLLTAQSFLVSSAPHPVKVMVTIAILALIFALRLTEADYELFQKAAAITAKSHETREDLGFSLTRTIGFEYYQKRMWLLVDSAYITLALIGGFLGLFILSPTLSLDLSTITVILAMTLTIVSIIVLEALIKIPEKTQKVLGFLFKKEPEKTT